MATPQLYHGDFRAYIDDVKDESIGFILTDPPFGQSLGYGRGQLIERYIQGDDNIESWFPSFISNAFRTLRNNATMACFWQWRTYTYFEQMALAEGFTIDTVGVWDKRNAGLGAGLAEGYEQIIFLSKGKPKQNYFRSNVFNYPRVHGRPDHPHAKPVALLRELIRLCATPGDVILDMFTGSGRTVEAALLEGFDIIAMEKDDEHYLTAYNRINALDVRGAFRKKGQTSLTDFIN